MILSPLSHDCPANIRYPSRYEAAETREAKVCALGYA